MTMEMREYTYAPELRQAAHLHDDTSVSFIASGSVRETAERTEWRGGAGQLIVKPRDVVHDDHFGAAGARFFTIILNDAMEVPTGYRWFNGGAPMMLFIRAVQEWRAGRAIDDVTTDLLAATDTCAPRSRRTPKLDEVAERVAQTDVSVASLAGELSIHPVALARAFRRVHGLSLTTYRRRARVRRAVELLSSTRLPLADVALESGFTDQSHFCRVFRSETGVTPARFRATV